MTTPQTLIPIPFPIPVPTPIPMPIQHPVQAAYRPDPSARPIELATAIALVMLAMALRWLPSREASASASKQPAISAATWSSSPTRPTLRQVLAAAFTGCAVGLFVGGSGGLFCGLLSTMGVVIFGSRRVSESEKRSRLQLVAAAPPVVDLFAAGLAAGLLPADAAAATASAFSPPTPAPNAAPSAPNSASVSSPLTTTTASTAFTASRLTSPHTSRLNRFRPRRLNPHPNRPIDEPTLQIAKRFAEAAQALRQGLDPETAWRPLAADGATAPVAAAALRASCTGAPAAETVTKAARDLWNAADQAAQAQLHSAAVRATVPLALCFLPAFVLLGVVPTMIGILAQLRT